VRAAAADLAVAAARRIIAAEVRGGKADKLIETAIGAVKSQLN
jgi:F0F1-type ATP synthase membrane subunit b/b'